MSPTLSQSEAGNIPKFPHPYRGGNDGNPLGLDLVAGFCPCPPVTRLSRAHFSLECAS
jgi:hypothetical protein